MTLPVSVSGLKGHWAFPLVPWGPTSSSLRVSALGGRDRKQQLTFRGRFWVFAFTQEHVVLQQGKTRVST